MYVSVGDVDARALAGGELPAELSGARALLVNQREAHLLTGLAPRGRARRWRRCAAAMSRSAPTAPSPQASTASCASQGSRIEAVDTTGAGDLFAAAYVWADHWAWALTERLRWAVLCASLSVRVATAVAGAVH